MQNINLERTSRQEILQELADSVKNSAVLALLGTNLVPKKKSVGFEWRVNVKFLQQGFQNLLVAPELTEKYPGKTLVIGGEKSEHTGRCKGISEARDIHSLFVKFFAHTEVVLIEEADHYLHYEYFDKVLKPILKFLKSD
jgi:hypothetical protein